MEGVVTPPPPPPPKASRVNAKALLAGRPKEAYVIEKMSLYLGFENKNNSVIVKKVQTVFLHKKFNVQTLQLKICNNNFIQMPCIKHH